IQQRLQVVAQGFPPAMAEGRNRDNRRPQVGGLALRPNVKGQEGLFAQSRLHTVPNDFLQGSTLRGHFHLKLEHGPRVKERDRPHYGLGASRRMKRGIALGCICWRLAFNQSITAQSPSPSSV